MAITVDTPPTCSITAPTNGATYTAPASVAISATATASSGHTIASVAFYAGSTLIGTVTTSPYNYTWSNVPASDYSLTVVATDNSGVATTSSAVNISRDTATAARRPPACVLWLKADAGVHDGWQLGAVLGRPIRQRHSACTRTSNRCSPASVTNAINGLPVDALQRANGQRTCTIRLSTNPSGTFYCYVVTQATTAQGTAAPATVSSPARRTTIPTTNYGFNLTCGTASAYSRADQVVPPRRCRPAMPCTTIGLGACFNYDNDPSNPALLLHRRHRGSAGLQPHALRRGNHPGDELPERAMGVRRHAADLRHHQPDERHELQPGVQHSPSTPPRRASGSATITKVEFYQGGTLLGTVSTSPYNFTWNSVAAGAYALTVKAY